MGGCTCKGTCALKKHTKLGYRFSLPLHILQGAYMQYFRPALRIHCQAYTACSVHGSFSAATGDSTLAPRIGQTIIPVWSIIPESSQTSGKRYMVELNMRLFGRVGIPENLPAVKVDTRNQILLDQYQNRGVK